MFTEQPGPIIKTDGYAEDFVVVRGESTYAAYYTEGTEREQLLCVACSKSPVGPFEPTVLKIYHNSMRLGSVIQPCAQTNWKWRIYFNRLYMYDARTVAYIESKGPIGPWDEETPCNLPHGEGFDLFGRQNSFYVQPCCRIVNGKFFMVVNRCVRTPNRSVDTSFIDSFISDDGVNFHRYKTPLISPRPGTVFASKIGNPYYYHEGDRIYVVAEGNANSQGWKLFCFELHYNDMITHEKPLINDRDILANPSLEKFDDLYYLYYGRFDGKQYRQYVATGSQLWTTT